MFKTIGVAITLLGVIINFAHRFILSKILKVTEPTDIQRFKVKLTGAALCIVGALIVFLLG